MILSKVVLKLLCTEGISVSLTEGILEFFLDLVAFGKNIRVFKKQNQAVTRKL